MPKATPCECDAVFSRSTGTKYEGCADFSRACCCLLSRGWGPVGGLSLRARLRAVASEPILLRAFLSLGAGGESNSWSFVSLGRFTWPDGSKYEVPAGAVSCYNTAKGLLPAGRTIRWKTEWPEPEEPYCRVPKAVRFLVLPGMRRWRLRSPRRPALLS